MQPSTIARTVATSPVPQKNIATVYFYNDSGPTLLGATLEVSDETGIIVKLSRHTYAVRELPVGTHKIDLGRQTQGFSSRMVDINMQPGETYYVVAAYDPLKSYFVGLAGDPFTIRAVDAATAKQVSSEMTLVP